MPYSKQAVLHKKGHIYAFGTDLLSSPVMIRFVLFSNSKFGLKKRKKEVIGWLRIIRKSRLGFALKTNS